MNSAEGPGAEGTVRPPLEEVPPDVEVLDDEVLDDEDEEPLLGPPLGTGTRCGAVVALASLAAFGKWELSLMPCPSPRSPAEQLSN